MAETHAHDWTDLGGGITACAVTGCQAVHHEHRYTQDDRGLWCCPCGAWTPKPPPSSGQVVDLSHYNQRKLEPRKPRAARQTVGWR